MKCAIVIAEGLKQIMMYAETPEEKQALAMFSPQEDVSLEIKPSASFYDNDRTPACAGYVVKECRDGYLRAYDSSARETAVMFVLRPKAKVAPKMTAPVDLLRVLYASQPKTGGPTDANAKR